MLRRKLNNRRKDRRVFSRTADRVKGLNATRGNPMRGGIRL